MATLAVQMKQARRLSYKKLNTAAGGDRNQTAGRLAGQIADRVANQTI
jgi:ribonuclease HI